MRISRFFDGRDQLSPAEARSEAMGDEIPEEVHGRRTSVDVYEVLWEGTQGAAAVSGCTLLPTVDS